VLLEKYLFAIFLVFLMKLIIWLLCCEMLWASVIHLNISFTNASLNSQWFVGDANFKASDKIFGVNFYTCLSEIGTGSCPGAQATFQNQYWVTTADQVSHNNWFKQLDVGDMFTGTVVIDIFAPLPYTLDVHNRLIFSSSVTACFKKKADYEMGAEICGQHGQPWTLHISDTSSVVSIDMFPAFGLSSVGNTSIVLPSFYSSQLNNSRDIPVYQPPSLLQNKVKRAVNIMILLDGSYHVVENYATRTGFESYQLMGQIPESIMIGISTIEFAYRGDFNQRTYEMTYEKALHYPNETCIYADATGGASKLLDWIDNDVIPSVLASIGEGGTGMDRGEVSIHGGSLGGLTSCYAATYRPQVFARAICSSPSNCFNFASGGLSSHIISNYLESGVSAKTVIQFLGCEPYASNTSSNQAGDKNQLGYLIKDDEAWQSIGLKPFYVSTTYTASNDAKHIPYSYINVDKLNDHIVVSYDVPAGQHAPSTWQQEFTWALPNLYRNDPYDKLRVPTIESLKYMSVEFKNDGNDDNNNDDDDSKWSATTIAFLVCFLFTTLCLATSIVFIVYLSNQLHQFKRCQEGSTGKSSPASVESINPMNNSITIHSSGDQ